MADKIIELKNISFTYRDSNKPALSNISFEITKGEWVSVIGHNGSGKSTLSRLLNGLLIPDKKKDSHIIIDNLELSDKTVWDIRNKIGIVFQNPDNQFVGATVQDDIAFGLENRNVSRNEMQKIVNHVISLVNMKNFKSAEPQLLSGGQKQRVAIAGILAIEPEIIILDEATSMLDPEGRTSILKLIHAIQKERNITVLAITHDLNEVLDSDRVLVLNNGELLANEKPQVIFEDNNLIKKTELELPFIYQVKKSLNDKGLIIPSEVDSEKELVKYLCQLNSKM